MKKTTTKNLAGIGEVCFRRNPRAKYLNIRVKRFDGVYVTVPGRMSWSRAQHYVRQKEDWIRKCLVRNERSRNAALASLDKPIKTRQHTVLLRRTSGADYALEFQGQNVHLLYPGHVELSDASAQQAIQRLLVEVYRKEAKQVLPPRVRLLADKFGFTFERVFIKNQRSRWGSCSARNNINLNVHLMRLSDDLIDYVILHELVHTEIKNHSLEFWARMKDVCPNCDKLRKELRRVEPGLFLQ